MLQFDAGLELEDIVSERTESGKDERAKSLAAIHKRTLIARKLVAKMISGDEDTPPLDPEFRFKSVDLAKGNFARVASFMFRFVVENNDLRLLELRLQMRSKSSSMELGNKRKNLVANQKSIEAACEQLDALAIKVITLDNKLVLRDTEAVDKVSRWFRSVAACLQFV